MTSAETKERLERDGIVILRGCLGAARVAQLNEARQALDAEHATVGDELRNGRFYSGDWPAAIAAISDIESWPEIVSTIRQVIGNDIALHYRRLLIKDARFKEGVAAHQDLPYFHGGLEKLHAFVPMSPNTMRNGGLRYLAGSHRYGLVGQGTIDIEKFRGLREIAEDLYPGDVVLMDHRTWHYSEASGSDEPRYLLQLIYQPSDDGSYVTEPKLISGTWLTDLRFPVGDAILYANIKHHQAENVALKERLATLEAEITGLRTRKRWFTSSV